MPEQPEIASLIYDIAVNNSESAYRRLFGLLFPQVKRFALCILKSNEYAEEVASDVLITLWRNRATLLQIENIRVYAFVIAKNLSLNLLKKNSRSDVISLDDIPVQIILADPTPDQVLITEELKKKLDNAIENLPPRCKIIFKLIREDGLSYKEAAEILGISAKTVDAQLVVAVKKIMYSIKSEYNLA